MELVPNLQAEVAHLVPLICGVQPERGVCVCVYLEKGDLLLHKVDAREFEY